MGTIAPPYRSWPKALFLFTYKTFAFDGCSFSCLTSTLVCVYVEINPNWFRMFTRRLNVIDQMIA